MNSLKYKIDTTKKYSTIYFVDSMRDTKIFMDNPSPDALPVQYHSLSTRVDFLDLIGKLPEVNRIGFVFDTYKLKTKTFLESEPFFTSGDLEEGQTTYSENLKLLRNLPAQIVSIDFLCCNTLKDKNWAKYYTMLPQTIGASNDQTGNINGNWKMENTGENVKSIYFGPGISAYTKTLIFDGINFNTSTCSPCDLRRNCVLSQSDFDMLGTGSYYRVIKPIKIKLRGKITISNPNQCIVIASDNVKIYGLQKSLILIDASSYYGLIMNGDANTYNQTYNGICVSNITIDKMSTGLESYNGWVAQANYGFGAKNNKFSKCVNNAPIENSGSGIIGDSSTCNIYKCANNGNISCSAGGIIGDESIDCKIVKCVNTGTIQNTDARRVGGICAGGINLEFIKCKNTGTLTVNRSTGVSSSGIIIFGSGGICGNTTKNSKFIKCKNTGNITNDNGAYVGGICGTSYDALLFKCSNKGTITSNSNGNRNGGICGYSGYSKIITCTNKGNITCNDSSRWNGGICGYSDWSQMTRCTNKGTITCNDGSNTHGGICGYSDRSRMTRCANKGTVTCNDTSQYNGGISGYSGKSLINTCVNKGTVTCNNSSYNNGGISGWFADNSQIIKSINLGTIICNANSINNAGIAGRAGNITIINTINAGDIKSSPTSNGNAGFISRFNGGLFGVSEYSSIINSYNIGKITGGPSTGNTNAAFISDSAICNNMAVTNCYTTYGPLVDTTVPGNILVKESGVSDKTCKFSSKEANKYLLDGWVKFDNKHKPWAIELPVLKNE